MSRFGGGVLTTPSGRGHSADSSQRSQILAQNRDICLPHLYSTPPLEGRFPSEYCHAVWYGKTRMAWLPDGKKILKISLLVLTQLTNVIDTRTDTACHRRKLPPNTGGGLMALSFPLPSLPLLSLSSPPLRSRAPQIQLGGLGERCELP